MTCGRAVVARSGQALQQQVQQSNVPGNQEGRSCPNCLRHQVATVQSWPRSSLIESLKSSAMPTQSSSVTRRILNRFYWKLQPTVGEWTIMRSIYLRFTRTTGSDGLQARTCQDVALIGRKLESIRLQNYLQERE
jgi:hypothetical protein